MSKDNFTVILMVFALSFVSFAAYLVFQMKEAQMETCVNDGNKEHVCVQYVYGGWP